LHTYSFLLYIYASAAAHSPAALSICPKENGKNMKGLRHDAIRELVARSPVTNQDELRRKLRRRGFQVTQATLSRDIHELRLFKGPSGYSLPNGNANGVSAAVIDDAPPSVEEMLNSFGLRVVHAMNQVIIRTVMGGAQPVAAALDQEDWIEIAGTIAGDDTVLVICQDPRRAADVEVRLRKILES
jgi:transcriptional regulator of arginine metabolism